MTTNSEDPTIRLTKRISLPDTLEPTTELLPPEKDQYLSKPFEFESEMEFNRYLKLRVDETLDSLFVNTFTKLIKLNNKEMYQRAISMSFEEDSSCLP